ncbi:response regulator transcription factor [Facilibium subflavum]|uniref:response regulator transcription factor n=1 Tax=Facilibium subflavum TaxID=2219058 RepID=UPI000E6512D1|nr:response regulator [Facilibium subflavum]
MNYIIHLIEDNQELTKNWATLWQTYGYQTITYHSGVDFLHKYKPHDIECILIDIWLPGANGDKLFHKIIAQGINAPCIFWSGRVSVELAVRLMREGAFSVLEKHYEIDLIKNTIDEAFSSCLNLRRKVQKLEIFNKKLTRLTPKEKEVFLCILQNKNVMETAQQRCVSPRTVTEQRKSIFKKLELPSANELYIYCIQIGYKVKKTGSNYLSAHFED